MLHILCVVLLSATTFYSSQSADRKLIKLSKKPVPTEQPKKEGDKLNKKRTIRSSSASPSSSAIISPAYNLISSYHPFLKAIRDEDLIQIKFHLDNPYLDINIQDINGNTALHLATKKNNFLIMTWLLEDPKVDPTKMNSQQKMPYHLIQAPSANATQKEIEQIRGTRHLFFAKAQIHIIINTICHELIAKNPKTYMTSDLMNQTIKTITDRINEEEKSQKNDRQLPTNALIEIKHINEFLKQKIFHSLEEQRKLIKLQYNFF